jgi:hypothetical protein
MTPLGDLPGGLHKSWGVTISGDGLSLAGWSPSSPRGSQSFVWTPQEGIKGIGIGAQTLKFSANGQILVGNIPTGGGLHNAFYYKAGYNMRKIKNLPGGFKSSASDTTEDGSVIVGYCELKDGKVAFIWDRLKRMRDLNVVLTDSGIDLKGWILAEATGISDDGTIIVGNGINPTGNKEAWIAKISEGKPGNLKELKTAKISLKIFSKTSEIASHPKIELIVPDGYKIVGGGARANWSGSGSLLTTSYPENIRKWIANSKDHAKRSPASITAYAIAIYDPDNEWDVQIFSKMSDPDNIPTISVEVPSDFLLTGGGAKVIWKGLGNLLTASFPADKQTWEARAKDHMGTSPAALTAYAIGIRPKNGGHLPKSHIFVGTGSVVAQPSHSVKLGNGYVLTGGGALDNWTGSGNLLTATYPRDSQTWVGEGKDHGSSDPSSITVYAIGINMDDTDGWVAHVSEQEPNDHPESIKPDHSGAPPPDLPKEKLNLEDKFRKKFDDLLKQDERFSGDEEKVKKMLILYYSKYRMRTANTYAQAKSLDSLVAIQYLQNIGLPLEVKYVLGSWKGKQRWIVKAPGGGSMIKKYTPDMDEQYGNDLIRAIDKQIKAIHDELKSIKLGAYKKEHMLKYLNDIRFDKFQQQYWDQFKKNQEIEMKLPRL